MTIREYLVMRVGQLEELMKQFPEDSNHYYALAAGMYELLLLGVQLDKDYLL